MARGRDICNTLKAIRKQIADANGIAYSPEECHFTGECKGTCPKCEQDVRDLEYELRRKQIAGKAIKVVGIAAGLVALTACSDGKPQRNASDIGIKMIEGKAYVTGIKWEEHDSGLSFRKQIVQEYDDKQMPLSSYSRCMPWELSQE